ncbi:g10756 [Coccomyxa viridis]|uniref:G10756 protein n=1 Tax=Coccomyxa viridis TaxID=1274662 RepID=A0ABP1G8R1_9CHLO
MAEPDLATAPAASVCSTSGRPAALPFSHAAYERLQRPLTNFTASSRSAVAPSLRRSVVVSASRSPPKEPWWEKNNPPNMKGISSVQQFVDELALAGNSLVVVDFYAKWCNACRSLFPKLCQMGNDNPDIVILKVDFDENRDIAKALVIKVLPYFHFYRGADGRVAAFSASVSKIQRLRDALELHNSPRCQYTKFDGVEEFPGILPQYIESNVVLHNLPQSAESAWEMPEQERRETREPAPV